MCEAFFKIADVVVKRFIVKSALTEAHCDEPLQKTQNRRLSQK
jgi:hypothetical protein